MHILRIYKINYLYIFEIDKQVTNWQMYRFGLLLSFIFVFLLLNQEAVFKIDNIISHDAKLPVIVMSIVFFLIFFLPIRFFQGNFRLQLGKAILHILVAPFGAVKFRHFFIADVFTSAKIMFFDTASMVCFYESGDYRSSAGGINCDWEVLYGYTFSVLPYWWRFWQCIHRYYYNRALTA